MLMLLLLMSFVGGPAFADYFQQDYPSYYPGYFSISAPAPIISLTLDPQESLNSAFRVSAREDRLADMIRLLDQKANINSQSDQGVTALMYAARNCSVPTVKTLLQRGADANVGDLRGRTALIYAAQGTCAPVIALLLRVPKIRAGHRDKQGKTAKDYAIQSASIDVDGPALHSIWLLSKPQARQRASRSLR